LVFGNTVRVEIVSVHVVSFRECQNKIANLNKFPEKNASNYPCEITASARDTDGYKLKKLEYENAVIRQKKGVLGGLCILIPSSGRNEGAETFHKRAYMKSYYHD
jgi:hypothetical protein